MEMSSGATLGLMDMPQMMDKQRTMLVKQGQLME
jgi:hypothetical protein